MIRCERALQRLHTVGRNCIKSTHLIVDREMPFPLSLKVLEGGGEQANEFVRQNTRVVVHGKQREAREVQRLARKTVSAQRSKRRLNFISPNSG